MMQKGKLYRTRKSLVLMLTEQDPTNGPQNDLRVPTTSKTPRKKTKITWSVEVAEDLRAFHGVNFEEELNFGPRLPIQYESSCLVPKGWIVMYVETGKTGSYKLICDDFIGWVSDTLNLLEELKEDE